MSDVIQLPDRMQRAWSAFEKQLRTEMSADCSPAEIDHVVSLLRPLYLRIAEPRNLDLSSVDAGLRSMNAWMYRVVSDLLTHLVAAEVRALRAEKP